jgi:hypothetical protein
VALQYRRQHIVKADGTLEEAGEVAAPGVGGRGGPLTAATAACVHGIAHYSVGGGEHAVRGLVWRSRWFSAAWVAGHAIYSHPGCPEPMAHGRE